MEYYRNVQHPENKLLASTILSPFGYLELDFCLCKCVCFSLLCIQQTHPVINNCLVDEELP
jgi:hypothetical protein